MKSYKKILKYILLGINVIMLIGAIICLVLVNKQVNLIEDYTTLIVILIFLLCVSLILLLIKTKWTLALGLVILLLSSIYGVIVGIKYNHSNKLPIIIDDYLPTDPIEIRIYYYKTSGEFDKLEEYQNYYKYRYFVHTNPRLVVINNIEELNEAIREDEQDSLYYELNKVSKENNYNEEYFLNHSLVLYIYNKNTNIADLKVADVKREQEDVEINIAISEGKIMDEKDKDENNIYLQEHTYVLFIETDKVQTKDNVKINLQNYDVTLEYEDTLQYLDKPVIYLYPEREMNVEVELLNKNNLTVSYPIYKDKWKVTAHPDGMLEIGNKKYYSLYYEAKSDIHNDKNLKEGFVVKRENMIEFLEEKLEILGLNYKEKEEFIIYWLPQLQNYEYVFIRFQTKEEINHNMPIHITPEPDSFIRIMMEWKGLEKPVEVEEQKLIKNNRNGFTVVEWGGTKLQ